MSLAKRAKHGFPGEFLKAEIGGPDHLCFGHNHPAPREDIFAKLRHRLTLDLTPLARLG
jgi:hypothetical protein